MDSWGPILILAGLLLLAIPPLAGYPLIWSVVIGSAGTALGAVSILVYGRRLLFAAASAPHAAFFAASVAFIISSEVGGSQLGWTILVGVSIVYGLGYLAYRGVDPDDAAAVTVSFSTSAGVIAAMYALTKYSYGGSIVSVIMGDPLLARTAEALVALAVGAASVLLAFLTAREIAYIGLDRDDAALSGIRLWLYDLTLYTLIGVTVMSLVRVVGFVIEHVLLLIPGALAVAAGGRSYETVTLSIGTTLLASGLGLLIAIILNLSPSGVIGLLIVVAYLLALALRR